MLENLHDTLVELGEGLRGEKEGEWATKYFKPPITIDLKKYVKDHDYKIISCNEEKDNEGFKDLAKGKDVIFVTITDQSGKNPIGIFAVKRPKGYDLKDDAKEGEKAEKLFANNEQEIRSISCGHPKVLEIIVQQVTGDTGKDTKAAEPKQR